VSWTIHGGQRRRELSEGARSQDARSARAKDADTSFRDIASGFGIQWKRSPRLKARAASPNPGQRRPRRLTAHLSRHLRPWAKEDKIKFLVDPTQSTKTRIGRGTLPTGLKLKKGYGPRQRPDKSGPQLKSAEKYVGLSPTEALHRLALSVTPPDLHSAEAIDLIGAVFEESRL
jgi:hypothetical protein